MSGNGQNIKQRDIKIVVPIDTTEISIRLMDWQRIYRKVKSIPKNSPLFLTLTGAFWGFGGSSILSFIALHQTAQNFYPWVKPSFCIIGIAAIILGFITAYFSKENNKVIESSCLEIQQDMKEVYSLFFPNNDYKL